MSAPESEFDRKMQKIAAEIAPHLLPRLRDDTPLKEFKLAEQEPAPVGMSGMEEVLAAHQWYDATTDNEDPATGCTGCADWFGSEDALDDGTFATHQAAMLTAAGFGPVKEAKAVALEEAAAKALGPSDVLLDAATCRWISMELRKSAAAVRGEG